MTPNFDRVSAVLSQKLYDLSLLLFINSKQRAGKCCIFKREKSRKYLLNFTTWYNSDFPFNYVIRGIYYGLSSIICQGVRELTQTYTAHEPVFFLLSARLNCNIPLEKELLHNDNSISGNKFKCFSLAKEQPTQKSCFSHTSKSLNVWVWELIYIVWLTVFHVIHLLLITKRLLYRANPSWPWYLSSYLS